MDNADILKTGMVLHIPVCLKEGKRMAMLKEEGHGLALLGITHDQDDDIMFPALQSQNSVDDNNTLSLKTHILC